MSPTLPQPAPSRARRLEAGKRWARLAQARAASRPGLCAIAPGRPDPAVSRGAPPPPQHPSPLRGTLGSFLRSPAEVEGNEGFPPQPKKELESPSSTPLEDLAASHDSRVMTSSPSPCA